MTKKILTLITSFVLTYLVLILIGPFLFNPSIDEHPYYRDEGFMSIAHQGGNLEVPDETMAAYEHAAALEIDVLEMDVHLAADGVLMAMHDHRVDRTTDGKGFISEMTTAQLKELNAAYWWPYHSNRDVEKKNVPADMEFPYRSKELRILTLEEIFRAFPDKKMVIEMKSEEEILPRKLGELIKRYGKEEEVVIASFHSEPMDRFRTLFPEIATSAPEKEIRKFIILHKIGLGFLYRPLAESFQVPERSAGIHILTPSFIEEAHSKNLKIEVWTINEREDMERIYEMGVDGIMTDRPSVLIDVIK